MRLLSLLLIHLSFCSLYGQNPDRVFFSKPAIGVCFKGVLTLTHFELLTHIMTYMTHWYLQRVKPFLTSTPSPLPQEFGGAGEQLVGRSTW